MFDPEHEFLIGAVVHPYNHTPENFADVPSASAISASWPVW